MLTRFYAVLLILLLVTLTTGCSDTSDKIYGTVERDRLTLIAPISEQIFSVHVREGQAVKAGDVLLQLNPRKTQSLVDQRSAELAEAQSNLDELTAGVRPEEIASAEAILNGAEAKLQDAEHSLQRNRELYQASVVTKADLDTAQANRDQAQAAKEALAYQLQEKLNGTRFEQMNFARAAVAAAEAQLSVAQEQLSDLSLRAGQDAIVDVLPWRSGDRVIAGTQLISLSATGSPYVRAYLPASWLATVDIGSKVSVWVDGQTQAIPATIRNIRNQPAFTPYYALNERDRSRLMYLTDIRLPPSAHNLATGIGVAISRPQK